MTLAALAWAWVLMTPLMAQESFKEVEAAAKKGDPQAIYKLGWYHMTGFDRGRTNMTSAVDNFKKAAALGVAEAQYRLGYIYDTNTPAFRGIRKDPKQTSTMQWYAQADANNVTAATYMLSQCYKLAEDFTSYVPLIQKAAKQGHTQAQAELAKLYFYGQGIGKDYVSAVAWAKLAAEQGDKGSIELCNDFLTLYKDKVTKADLAKGEEIAETLRKDIAETIKKLK